MLNDLRHGIRVLMQAKGWTTVVVLTLAVGIGANTAVFTAVNGLLLKKLPVHDPDSLVRLRWGGKNDMANDHSEYGRSPRGADGQPVHSTFSYPMLLHFKSANQTLTDLTGSRPTGGVIVTIDGRAEPAGALLVTGNYFQMLGVGAQLGRTLVPEDDAPSSPAVATLSDGYWRTRFGGDRSVLGKTLRINNVPVTIVGVTEPSFTGTQRVDGDLQDLSMPLRLDDQISGDAPRMADATAWWVQVTGRLKAGISPEQVRGNLEPVFQRQARAGLEAHLAAASEEVRKQASNQERVAVPHLLVDSGNRGTYSADQSQMNALAILGVVVVLVLLLVCANVANLLLARTAARQREVSVRMSIGATRGRLVRQLLTEGLLLSGLGGIAGMALAQWSQAMLPAPVGSSAPPEWRVAVFTALVSASAGIIFGIAPALRATSIDIGVALKETGRSLTGSNTWLPRALLVVQVSISVVLLVGAGLFLRTLDNLRSVDIGFDPQNLVFVRVNAESSGMTVDQTYRYFQEGMTRLRAVPGVRSATVSFPTLMSGGGFTTSMYVDGRVYRRGRDVYVAERDDIHRVIAAPSYFDTIGIRLLAGRGFTDRDDQKAPRVAIINESAARKFFPNENPIGRRFGGEIENTSRIEIVGLVHDVRYNELREQPPPTVYVPHLQANPEELVFTVRTATDPAGTMSSLRTAVSDANPNIPVLTVETQISQLERRYAQEKVLAQAYALFGGIALFVAAIGLFGLLSYNVSRRTREIGIRMAMGAQRPHVLALIGREVALLVAAGLVAGVAIALAAARLVESQLFGLEPTDPATILGAVALLIAVATLAGFLPARRATRVDPMVALRYE